MKLDYKNSIIKELVTRIFSASVWGLTGSLLNRLLLFATGVFLARFLTVELYGEYSVIKSTLSTFVVFGSTGLGVTATKYIAEYKNHSAERAGSIIILTVVVVASLSCFLGLSCFLFAKPFADRVLKNPEIYRHLQWMSIPLVFASLNSLCNGILLGLERFNLISMVNIISGIVVLVSSYFLTMKWSIKGALSGLGIYFLTGLFLNISFILHSMKKDGITINIHAWKKEVAVLWKFSAPAILNSVFLSSAVWIGNSLLVRQDDGLKQMAGFEILNQGRMMLIFIPLAINQTGLPILSNILSGERKQSFSKAVLLYFIFNMAIALSVGLFIVCFGKYFLGLYGPIYVQFYWPLIVLTASGLLSVIANVCGNVIQSKSKAWTGFGFNFLWTVLFLALAVYLLQKGMGAMGLCLANLIAYIVHVFLQLIYIYSRLCKNV